MIADRGTGLARELAHKGHPRPATQGIASGLPGGDVHFQDPRLEVLVQHDIEAEELVAAVRMPHVHSHQAVHVGLGPDGRGADAWCRTGRPLARSQLSHCCWALLPRCFNAPSGSRINARPAPCGAAVQHATTPGAEVRSRAIPPEQICKKPRPGPGWEDLL